MCNICRCGGNPRVVSFVPFNALRITNVHQRYSVCHCHSRKKKRRMLSDAKDLFEITLEGNHSTADVPAIVLSSPKSRLCKTLRSAHNGKIVLHHESPRRPLLWMLSASLLGTLSRSIVPLSLADELTTSTSRREDGRGRKKRKEDQAPKPDELDLAQKLDYKNPYLSRFSLPLVASAPFPSSCPVVSFVVRLYLFFS